MDQSAAIISRLESIEGRLDRIEVDFATERRDMKAAFPNGDFEGHRRYHDLIIEQIEERRRLRQAILEKSLGGLVWSAIVGFGALFWYALVAFLKTFKGGS